MSDVILMDRGYRTAVPSVPTGRPHALILVVSDNPGLSRSLETICDFLNIGVEHVMTDEDVPASLRAHRPMAVVSEVDGRGQDGFHVMMAAADHDRDLPFLLLTGHDPTALGAADAIQELWGLTTVLASPDVPGVGQLVDFLFRAGRRMGCLGLMPA